jgi:hypothetical protein
MVVFIEEYYSQFLQHYLLATHFRNTPFNSSRNWSERPKKMRKSIMEKYFWKNEHLAGMGQVAPPLPNCQKSVKHAGTSICSFIDLVNSNLFFAKNVILPYWIPRICPSMLRNYLFWDDFTEFDWSTFFIRRSPCQTHPVGKACPRP